MCRKQHGSLFQTSLGVAREAFRWLRGADEIVHYRATAAFERPFCRRCGAKLPAVSHDARYWHVPAGLLDGDPGARPRSHIFVDSRSPLAALDDALPRHAAYPPGVALPEVAAARRPPDTPADVVGSCLCGAIAFAALELPRRVVHCHCPPCRRSRGAAFSSTLHVRSDAFSWIRGHGRVQSYVAAEGRHGASDLGFCTGCGSVVPGAATGSPPAEVNLPAGAIDTPLPPLPAVHVYVGAKAPWYDIVDTWPQFAELPPRPFTELLR
jgi:hypothetical protein